MKSDGQLEQLAFNDLKGYRDLSRKQVNDKLQSLGYPSHKLVDAQKRLVEQLMKMGVRVWL